MLRQTCAGRLRARSSSPICLRLLRASGKLVVVLRRGVLQLLAWGWVVGCEASQIGNASFPAQYAVQNPVYDDVVDCAGYATFEVSDAREDRAKVGTRVSERGPSNTYSITMTGDLSAPVTVAAKKAFDMAHLRQSEASSAGIKFSLARLGIDEKTVNNSEYDGSFVFDIFVLDRRNQSVVWQARKTGHGHNYGRPGTETNYKETLSRSLEDVIAQILKDPEFSRALCKLGPQAKNVGLRTELVRTLRVT